MTGLGPRAEAGSLEAGLPLSAEGLNRSRGRALLFALDLNAIGILILGQSRGWEKIEKGGRLCPT